MDRLTLTLFGLDREQEAAIKEILKHVDGIMFMKFLFLS